MCSIYLCIELEFQWTCLNSYLLLLCLSLSIVLIRTALICLHITSESHSFSIDPIIDLKVKVNGKLQVLTALPREPLYRGLYGMDAVQMIFARTRKHQSRHVAYQSTREKLN